MEINHRLGLIHKATFRKLDLFPSSCAPANGESNKKCALGFYKHKKMETKYNGYCLEIRIPSSETFRSISCTHDGNTSINLLSVLVIFSLLSFVRENIILWDHHVLRVCMCVCVWVYVLLTSEPTVRLSRNLNFMPLERPPKSVITIWLTHKLVRYERH
jgi:hypothetical protein